MAKFRFAFFLLQLSRDNREEAARTMQTASGKLNSARQKLDQVNAYRNEYRARLTQSAQGGITVTQYRDYQLFLTRLDTAAEQQALEVQRAQVEYERCKAEWMECEKKVKAFEALEERHQAAELRREGQREQKLNDEFNSRPKANGPGV